MDLRTIAEKSLKNLSNLLELQERAIALGKLADNPTDIADYAQIAVEMSLGLEKLTTSAILLNREAEGEIIEEFELTPEEQVSLCQQLETLRSSRDSK